MNASMNMQPWSPNEWLLELKETAICFTAFEKTYADSLLGLSYILKNEEVRKSISFGVVHIIDVAILEAMNCSKGSK